MKRDLLIKSTASIAAFSLAFGVGFSTVNVKGSDSANLSSEKAIAGLDLSLDGLISVGGSDIYAYEMENIIESTTNQDDDSQDTTVEDNKTTDNKAATATTDKAASDKKASTADKAKADKTAKTDKTTSAKAASKKDKNADDSTAEDKAAAKKTAQKKVSEYANIGISIANDYVNVRKKNSTDSEIVGKLYRGCAATILKQGKEWVKIKSGNVEGYINKEYLAIGFDAEELVDKYGTKYGTVNTMTLNVREKKSTDCKILTQIPVGETYQIKKEYKDWVKISIDNDDLDGYVAKEYMDLTVKFKEAVSIEEEKEAQRKAEEAKKAQQEQERKLKEQQEARKAEESQSSSSSSSKSSSSSSQSSSSSSSKSSSSSSQSSSSSSSKSSSSSSHSSSSSQSDSSPAVSSGSTTGDEVAAYAQKFIGNRYVYGGTSLTNGTDCSGFTQSVYKSFGISIPRDSRSQSVYGTKVSISDLRPGDLIFYTNSSGRVNHVAMYIGGGRVCHASNERDGIKTSVYNYRTPYCARRIIE